MSENTDYETLKAERDAALNIYPTQSECLTISTLIKERKPNAVLMCSEVYR
ncbi:Uncharacterised protein [Yersinia pseudotuberculosis]|uniref:hypothetical protein n=1 Tax=Yersinia pseudotuberculosis TaxID=633 RepID=UPI0005DDFF80|nr:hypothetical protein [Yersinia pseudotuberculosis]CNK61217.1 Uncharacterised protein [Yersinia pseudotuberculosis]